MRVGGLLLVIGICLTCEAHIHADDNAFVEGVVTDSIDNTHDSDNTIATTASVDVTKKPNTKITPKTEKKEFDRSMMAGLDLPLDAFTLHHPFIHSSITDYEYSQWYFLFFMVFDKSSIVSVDVSLTVPEIIKSLSSKLSVPASVFSISRAEKYRSNSISANLSLTNHTIPRLHQKLCNLQNTSPLFWIRGTRYKLVQVIHDKNQHLYIRNNEQVKNGEWH
jgi:hypothetical protein